MDLFQQAWEYITNPQNRFLLKVAEHLQLSGVAILLAVAIGVPVGIMVSRYALLSRVAVNMVGILRVIPSIAILFLFYPLFGLGAGAPLLALTILAVPPLLINTDAGMRGVDPAAIEAGRGMGMSYWQLLGKVQLPLALPVVLAGLRIAAIEVIASATLATFIGGGGLGEFVFRGLTLARDDILLAGAVPIAALALIAEVALAYLQRRLTPRQAV
ncbi:MAG TPA: ABC transporter permease [Chloroflexia bacterium]|nr:ABC transporter permease [Chloroflexia bacterium]